MSRSAWKEVSRAQRRYSKAGESRLGWGLMRPRRLAAATRVANLEAGLDVARYEYRAQRRRRWAERVVALRLFFPLLLKTLLAPYWVRGAERGAMASAIEADFVAEAVQSYKKDEADALRRVVELRKELELAGLEVRHCRERRENMEMLNYKFVRARLVASLVDAENDDDDRLEWTVVDERRGAVA